MTSIPSEKLVVFNEDEFNFELFFNSLLRSKNLIFLIISLATISSIIYSYKVKPIWSGSFNIVTNEENNTTNNLTDSSFTIGNLLQKSDSTKTQEYILKSPSVLMPVFNYVKDYYKSQNIKTKNLTFKNWLKSDLNIKYKDLSNVLEVKYFNRDKKLINNVLELISLKYKEYSKSNREKILNKTISYLQDQQKLMKNKSLISTNNFNKFSIENGLGNIDGFVDIDFNPNINLNNFSAADLTSINLKRLPNSINSGPSGAGERYGNQFNLLEQYESTYVDLSSKLNDNSSYMINLKNKIDNLKSSLKRPNEILIEFRNLKKISQRDELILNNIETKLETLKLERLNKPDTWQLISTPTIDEKKVFPQKKRIVGLTFLFSSLFGIFISIFKDKFSKTIYSLEKYQDQLSFSYLDKLYTSNLDLSTKTIKNQLKNIKSEKIGIINFSEINQKLLLNEINKNNTIQFYNFNFENLKKLEKETKIILLLENGGIDLPVLTLINKYNFLENIEVIGWFFVDSKTKLN